MCERQRERCRVRDGHVETDRASEESPVHRCPRGRGEWVSPHCAPPPAPALGADLAGAVAVLHFAGLAGLFIDFRAANDHAGWKKLLWPD